MGNGGWGRLKDWIEKEAGMKMKMKMYNGGKIPITHKAVQGP